MPAARPGRRQTRKARLEAAADPDARPTDAEFWADAALVVPEKKVPVHIRLNPAVVEFFKRQGPGYQSRINQVLERYVAHQERAVTTRLPPGEGRMGAGDGRRVGNEPKES